MTFAFQTTSQFDASEAALGAQPTAFNDYSIDAALAAQPKEDSDFSSDAAPGAQPTPFNDYSGGAAYTHAVGQIRDGDVNLSFSNVVSLIGFI